MSIFLAHIVLETEDEAGFGNVINNQIYEYGSDYSLSTEQKERIKMNCPPKNWNETKEMCTCKEITDCGDTGVFSVCYLGVVCLI